jgi:23S rRNA (uracil1939-C5)-methyltransferase
MSIRDKHRQIEVDIVKFSKKGNGIGYFERQDKEVWPVEVSFTLPGDRVCAQLMRKRSGVYPSILEEIIHPSPERITPKCVHFGVCGGCRWQNLSYENQLKEKEQFVAGCFGDLLTDSVDVYQIVPTDDPWNYRNKMEYSFSSDREGNHYLGLMMDKGKGKVVNLTECHLPNPWFIEAVKAVRAWWKESTLEAYHSFKNIGSLRTLTLREGMRTGDRMVNLTVSGNPDYALKKHDLEGFVAFVRDAVEPVDPDQRLSIFLTIQQIHKGSPTQFYEMHLYGADTIREVLYITTSTDSKPEALTFHISPAAFFQPNSFQAEKLYSLAMELAGISSEHVVYDLYCGTGTLGICAAKRAKQVVGVELSPESAHDARHNVVVNGLKNVAILTGAVRRMLGEIKQQGMHPDPDVVMVDPPRAGLDPHAIQQLIELSPPKILYVSCNPTTQVENIREFINHGYSLKAVQPVDQFPHTVHIENIVLLVK